MARARVPRHMLVMLGDTPYDVEAAQRAGIAAVGVLSGGWSPEDLRGAVAVYRDVEDVLAKFEGSPFASIAGER